MKLNDKNEMIPDVEVCKNPDGSLTVEWSVIKKTIFYDSDGSAIVKGEHCTKEDIERVLEQGKDKIF